MASISRSRGRLGRRFFDRSRRHIGDRVRRGRGVAACPRCLNAAGPRRGRRERSVFWLKRSRTRGRPGDLLLPNHQSKAPSRKQASTSTVRSDRRRSPSAGHAHDKRDREDHQEYEEQYLRDTRRRRGDAAKPKNGCDDRDDQEYQRPVENGNLQLTGRGTGAPWLINNRFASDCVIRHSFASAAWRSNASVSSSHNSANV